MIFLNVPLRINQCVNRPIKVRYRSLYDILPSHSFNCNNTYFINDLGEIYFTCSTIVITVEINVRK